MAQGEVMVLGQGTGGEGMGGVGFWEVCRALEAPLEARSPRLTGLLGKFYCARLECQTPGRQ